MNLTAVLDPLPSKVFRTWRAIATAFPGGTIKAFGPHDDQISAIVVINLDRQPERWQRMIRELRRFSTTDQRRLIAVTRRLTAVDARDGRAVAATADVDPNYRIGDQLYVQPDDRLSAAFPADEPVQMTRQETAVARSHIEAWKSIAYGTNEYTLVLEDDAWIRPGARRAIDRGWKEIRSRGPASAGPMIAFLSYQDAGGTATREDVRSATFRPIRGLWHLSGYVLSREGAEELLRAMPVVGPVDVWINYRLAEIEAFALNQPAILQRKDAKSDNSYSVMPYLARAGVIDTVKPSPTGYFARRLRVLAWTASADFESLAMALSMLGFSVRVFERGDASLNAQELASVLDTFDAIVNPPLTADLIRAMRIDHSTRIVVEADAAGAPSVELSDSRSAILDPGNPENSWRDLCALLDVERPAEAFPRGASTDLRLFRDPQPHDGAFKFAPTGDRPIWDVSPWVLPTRRSSRTPTPPGTSSAIGVPLVDDPLTASSPHFSPLRETFPGNLAWFDRERVRCGPEGTELVLENRPSSGRPLSSGALKSVRDFRYGIFRAEIRAARGAGVITGFFLHRSAPRQEIDIEFFGSDPRRMLINVFFNPGDAGTDFDYGYRGTPHWIDLGFDSTIDFHEYSIEWAPDRIAWCVDGDIVHERESWGPTPIPHLDLSLHMNLWASTSQDLAGRLNRQALPSFAQFRNVRVIAQSARTSPSSRRR